MVRRAIPDMRSAETRGQQAVPPDHKQDARGRRDAGERAGKETDHGADGNRHAESADSRRFRQSFEWRAAGRQTVLQALEAENLHIR